MSKPFAIGLITVFIIHFAAFFYLYVKRRRVHYVYWMSSFLLLIFYMVMRSWWHDLTLFGHFAYTYLRVAAWVTTGLGVLLYLRFKLTSARQS